MAVRYLRELAIRPDVRPSVDWMYETALLATGSKDAASRAASKWAAELERMKAEGGT